MLAGELGGEPVDVVVVALDRDQRAAVDRGGDDLLLLEVGGHQHDRADAGPRSRGGDGVGEVAGGGAGQHGEAELAGRGQRHGDDAVLERVGRVAAVVLDPQRLHAQGGGEPVGLDEAGEARLGVGEARDVGRYRQECCVSPDVARPGEDVLAGEGREVVADLERPEALQARVVRAERLSGPTLAADQLDGVAERAVADGVGGAVRARDVAGRERHDRPVPLLIFPVSTVDAGRTWHLTGSRAFACERAGCRGFSGPYPSTPLDERHHGIRPVQPLVVNPGIRDEPDVAGYLV